MKSPCFLGRSPPVPHLQHATPLGRPLHTDLRAPRAQIRRGLDDRQAVDDVATGRQLRGFEEELGQVLGTTWQ